MSNVPGEKPPSTRHHVLTVLKTVGLGMFDALSDMNMIIQFILAGEKNFALVSIGFLVLSGIVSGLLLGWSLGADTTHRHRMVSTVCHSHPVIRYLVSIAFGFCGLAPAVKASVLVAKLSAMEAEGESHMREEILLERGRRDLGWFEVVEMLLETSPQSAVQVFIGVSYGIFEAAKAATQTEDTTVAQDTTMADNSFASTSLMISVGLGFVSAGATIFAFESRRRNHHLPYDLHLSAISKYGLFTIFGRAAQVGTLIFGVALSACAYQGAAIPAVLAAVMSIIYITTEAVSENHVQAGTQHYKPNLAHIAAVCVAIITIWGFGVEPASNNYASPVFPDMGPPRCQPIPRFKIHNFTDSYDMATCSQLHPIRGTALPQGSSSCRPFRERWLPNTNCQFTCGSPLKCNWPAAVTEANGASCVHIVELDDDSGCVPGRPCSNVTLEECYTFKQYAQCTKRTRSVTAFLTLFGISLLYVFTSFVVDPVQSFYAEKEMDETDFKMMHAVEMEWKRKFAGGDMEENSIDEGLVQKFARRVPFLHADSSIRSSSALGYVTHDGKPGPLLVEKREDSAPSSMRHENPMMSHKDSSNDI